MAIREQRFISDGDDDAVRIFLDNPEIKVNYGKTLGLWVLFVGGEARAELLEGLRRELKSGKLASLALSESAKLDDTSNDYLFAQEEGYLTREQFFKRLHHFEMMGFDGAWIYVDGGSSRDKSARRILAGKSPRGTAREKVLRNGVESEWKDVPFRLRQSGGRWLTE
jgi:hypothetical protein